MNDKDAPIEPIDTPEALELTAIEFESPGRFAVHNPQPATADTAQSEPAPFILGQHEPLERFSMPQEARAHALALIQQAQRSLCLYSENLEPWLYHSSSVQQACTRFLLSSPRARLRILLRDTTRAVKEGHRLLALSRRLSSNLHIRKFNPDYPSDELAFLIADDRGAVPAPGAEPAVRLHPVQRSGACAPTANPVRPGLGHQHHRS